MNNLNKFKMLLLLLKMVRVKDLFEVKQGFTVVSPKNSSKDTDSLPNKYKVINLSGINTSSRFLNINDLADHSSEKPVSPDKLLTRNDYLLSCKGVVKGFSLRFSDEIFDDLNHQSTFKGIIASNHFFILRLRKIEESNSKDTYFFHNLLDIISAELNKIANNKKGIAKYLTIGDVENYTFNLSDFDLDERIEKFNGLFKVYEHHLRESYLAKKQLDVLNKSFSDKIIYRKQKE